jgi:hypothetical protein
MLNKIYNIKDLVYSLLLNWPEMRDNDRQLMLNVWAKQDATLTTDKLFKDFAADFKRGKFADPESIRRTRQKLQEVHPELRGRTYAARTGLMLEMRDIMPKMKI